MKIRREKGFVVGVTVLSYRTNIYPMVIVVVGNSEIGAHVI